LWPSERLFPLYPKRWNPTEISVSALLGSEKKDEIEGKKRKTFSRAVLWNDVSHLGQGVHTQTDVALSVVRNRLGDIMLILLLYIAGS
jgi:hypothetical protein